MKSEFTPSWMFLFIEMLSNMPDQEAMDTLGKNDKVIADIVYSPVEGTWLVCGHYPSIDFSAGAVYHVVTGSSLPEKDELERYSEKNLKLKRIIFSPSAHVWVSYYMRFFYSPLFDTEESDRPPSNYHLYFEDDSEALDSWLSGDSFGIREQMRIDALNEGEFEDVGEEEDMSYDYGNSQNSKPYFEYAVIKGILPPDEETLSSFGNDGYELLTIVFEPNEKLWYTYLCTTSHRADRQDQSADFNPSNPDEIPF